MRLTIIAALAGALMAISACNREAEAPQTGQAPATASGEQTLGERYVDLLPQWVPIANTPGGGSIAYDLKGVRAMMAQGRNEILLQVRHASPAEWRLPGEGGTRIITYNVEQVRMRFDCAKETYVILDRRVLDADGAVIETVAATEQELGAPLLVRENGLAQVARDPACAPRT